MLRFELACRDFRLLFNIDGVKAEEGETEFVTKSVKIIKIEAPFDKYELLTG